MAGIIGIIAFLTVLGLSLVITRVATVALMMTGLSYEIARFQARSAFTGTGFTTSEAEHVVNHPVRRRIIMLLMIVRSAGLITIVLSLILSLAGTTEDIDRVARLGWILAGVFVLWLLSGSRVVERVMHRLIERALGRWTHLPARDYVHLLRLAGNYSITEIQVKEGDWLVGKQLRDCTLRDEGVTVLGITRADGDYVGVPNGDTEIFPEDILLLYGRSDSLRELDTRADTPQGDAAHAQAVTDQQRRAREQDRRQQEQKSRRQGREPG